MEILASKVEQDILPRYIIYLSCTVKAYIHDTILVHDCHPAAWKQAIGLKFLLTIHRFVTLL